MITVAATSLVEALAGLADAFKLVAVYAFGSRAVEIAERVRGEVNPQVTAPDSDVDIGVLPQRGHHLTAQDRVRLMLALEDVFEVGRVDLVILPEASLAMCRSRAEQLWKGVQGLSVNVHGELLRGVTTSAGVAAFPEHGTTMSGLLRAADAALYTAKKSGRNRTVLAPQPSA